MGDQGNMLWNVVDVSEDAMPLTHLMVIRWLLCAMVISGGCRQTFDWMYDFLRYVRWLRCTRYWGFLRQSTRRLHLHGDDQVCCGYWVEETLLVAAFLCNWRLEAGHASGDCSSHVWLALMTRASCSGLVRVRGYYASVALHGYCGSPRRLISTLELVTIASWSGT